MFEKIEKKHFTSTTSTMDFVKEVRDPLSTDTLYRISADSQTKGRGQYSRSFVGFEKKSLLCTYVFAIDESKPSTPLFIEVAALELARMLKRLNVFPLIKWPNDLLVGEKKIAGLLAEITHKEGISWCSLGVGLNVSLNKEEVLQVNDTTTSILLETGDTHEVASLQETLDELIFNMLNRFSAQGFKPFYDPFNTFFLFTNKNVAICYKSKLIEGLCLGFNVEGQMQVRGSDGAMHALHPAFIEKMASLQG